MLLTCGVCVTAVEVPLAEAPTNMQQELSVEQPHLQIDKFYRKLDKGAARQGTQAVSVANYGQHKVGVYLRSGAKCMEPLPPCSYRMRNCMSSSARSVATYTRWQIPDSEPPLLCLFIGCNSFTKDTCGRVNVTWMVNIDLPQAAPIAPKRELLPSYTTTYASLSATPTPGSLTTGSPWPLPVANESTSPFAFVGGSVFCLFLIGLLALLYSKHTRKPKRTVSFNTLPYYRNPIRTQKEEDDLLNPHV